MTVPFDEPVKSYAAYIFDLDGTLVDSMPHHFVAWNKAMAEARLPIFDEDDFYAMGGRSGVDIVAEMAEELGRDDIDPEQVATQKRNFYLEEMSRVPVRMIDAVVAFARRHKGIVPMAIATGSMRSGAIKTLESAGIDDLFDVIITPEDVVHGKPAPDMFLLAAELLGANPADCCVFEDADPGIEAACAAGMDYVRVFSRS